MSLDKDIVEAFKKILLESTEATIVTHADLDGVASAALLYNWLSSNKVRVHVDVVGVRGLYKVLRRRLEQAASKPSTSIIVCDFSLQSLGEAYPIISATSRRRVNLVWIDHHEWPSKVIEALRAAGVILVHDRSKPTSRIVCELLNCESNELLRRIALLGIMDDECVRDEEGLVAKWRLVLRYLKLDDLARVVTTLSEGEVWPAWADEVYKRAYEEYKLLISEAMKSKSLYDINGLKIAVVVPNPRLNACDLELNGIIKAGEVDVAVIVYPKSISIRTYAGINASCIARKLGGGGHKYVAGAPRPTGLGPAQIARQVAVYALECKG